MFFLSKTLKKKLRFFVRHSVNIPLSFVSRCTFTNYLVRKSSNISPNLVCAMLLGVPWDPMESKDSLSKFWNNIVINKHMTQSLIENLKR